MKRTHTETVEYFEHDGDRYRRFADGTWHKQGIQRWVPEADADAKQLEAIYQQPQRCKTCKFYDENPHLHCAVHPMGPEGVCGDWEERPIQEPVRGEKRIYDRVYADLVGLSSRAISRSIPHILESAWGLCAICGRNHGPTIGSCNRGDSDRPTQIIEFVLGEAHGEPTTVTMPVDAPGLTRIGSSTFRLRMDEMIAYGMNELWGIHSVAGNIAIISGGKVERIVVGRTESAPEHTLWEHPDIVHEREVREGVEQYYRQITNQYFVRELRRDRVQIDGKTIYTD